MATHQSKFRLVERYESNHKEADTKLFLHAPDASSSGDTTLRIHCSDRDVLLLLLRWYSAMCQDADLSQELETTIMPLSLDPSTLHWVTKRQQPCLHSMHLVVL